VVYSNMDGLKKIFDTEVKTFIFKKTNVDDPWGWIIDIRV